jgi:hypothetical protein
METAAKLVLSFGFVQIKSRKNEWLPAFLGYPLHRRRDMPMEGGEFASQGFISRARHCGS